MKSVRIIALSIFLKALVIPVAAQPPVEPALDHVTPWIEETSTARTSQAPETPARSLSIPLNLNSWTPIGPAPVFTTQGFSGRIVGIAAHPTDANTIYIAAAGGGVWKTTNGGTTWIPLTDSQPTLAMGAIAIAPSNPAVIYAGTGEANNSTDSHFGGGILVSTDAGASWKLTGTTGMGNRTAAIAVDPTNDKIAYAAMGDGNGVNTGIFKTTDGGTTWQNMTSAFLTSRYTYSDVKIDPNNPSVIYIAIGAFFGVGANGVYKSTNGGVSWQPLPGAPSGASTGRIALAIAKSNSQVIYVASQDAVTFGLQKLLRSDDGGATFTDLTAGTPNFLQNQGFYDIYLAVDPTNPAIVYAGGASANIGLLRSTNSGLNWTGINIGVVPPFVVPHVDHHAGVFDANGLLLDGSDGGIFRLENPATPLWRNLNGNLNTIQVVGGGLHPSNPDKAIVGSQDNGTSLYSGDLQWNLVEGGDGGVAKFSPTQPTRTYHVAPVSSFGPTRFFRRSDDGGLTWTSKTNGLTNTETFAFYPPFVVDPGNGDRLLLAGDRIFETTNGADSWVAISAPGEAGWSLGGAVRTIGLAKSDPNTIYAAVGASVFVTTNHGVSWTSQRVSPLGYPVYDLQVDPQTPTTAYAAINGFELSGNVVRTTDGGATWRFLPILGISTSLRPLFALPVRSLQISPNGSLYAGAEDGVYVLDASVVATCNSGPSSPQCAWRRVGTGFPNVQVTQIELNTSLGILAAATYGRGVWEIAFPKEPALGVSIAHGAGFEPGKLGATYSITVKNSGTGPTTAPVTVTTTLPPEFTPVSIGGSGWTCTQPAGPCSRTDALANAATYPVLTLIVNIATSVSPQVISRVTVQGGGAPDATASDAAVLCNYSITPTGQIYPAAGGPAVVAVTAPAGCPWSVINTSQWITTTGSTAGNGSGTATFRVETNVGLPRTDSVRIAGQNYTIQQQAAFIPGVNLQGSMPFIAAQGNWKTTFTLVNLTPAVSQARFSMFDDSGANLQLPLILPDFDGSVTASALDRTLNGNASTVIATADPATQPVRIGSAQLSADSLVNGFAIFSYLPTQQEAVVPMEARNAGFYILPYDNANGLGLGLSLANLTTRNESIAVTLRDEAGTPIGAGTVALTGNGQKSFVLADQFPATAGKRGSLEFSLAPGARVAALGVRYTPPGTLTTIPVLVSANPGFGSIAHLAVGNGWKTTFVLVNTSNSPGDAHLRFYNDQGDPLALPWTMPQTGDTVAISTAWDRTVPAKSTVLIESTGPVGSALLSGSAQFSTDGAVTGFVIFRYAPNGQEAVVPLEDRTANAYVLAFDNTGGVATGVAVSNASAQTVTFPVTIRNEAGQLVGSSSITLPANGHTSFVLSDRFVFSRNLRGTVEFGATTGKIAVIGIRTPPRLTFTTLPALAK